MTLERKLEEALGLTETQAEWARLRAEAARLRELLGEIQEVYDNRNALYGDQMIERIGAILAKAATSPASEGSGG